MIEWYQVEIWYDIKISLDIFLLARCIVLIFSIFILFVQIYSALRRRRNLMGPNATAAHQQQLNEDNRQALVLFGIVLIFFASNVPRILLNLHEVRFKIDLVCFI